MKKKTWLMVALGLATLSMPGCGGGWGKTRFQMAGIVTDEYRGTPLEGAYVEVLRKECIKRKDDWLGSCTHVMASILTGPDGRYSFDFEYPPQEQTPDKVHFSYSGAPYESADVPFDGTIPSTLDIQLMPGVPTSRLGTLHVNAMAGTTDLEILWDMQPDQWFDSVVLARGTEAQPSAEVTRGQTYPVGSTIGSFQVVYSGPFAPLFTHAEAGLNHYRHVDATGTNDSLFYYVAWGFDSYRVYSARSGAGYARTPDILPPGPPTNVSHTWNSTSGIFELNWTNPPDPDLWGIWILRSTTGPVNGTLVNGTSYTIGDTVGNAEVWRLGSIANQSAGGTDFVQGSTVYFRLVAADDERNYATSVDYSATLP